MSQNAPSATDLPPAPHELLELVVGHTHEGIVVADATGACVWANDRAAELIRSGSGSEVHAAPIFDCDGELVYTISYFRDVPAVAAADLTEALYREARQTTALL